MGTTDPLLVNKEIEGLEVAHLRFGASYDIARPLSELLLLTGYGVPVDMDQVHVVRHKVLVEGRSQRAVARELGLARVTVRKYVDQSAPARQSESAPRGRPVWDAVAARVQALLTESGRWTGGKQRLTATRLHVMLLAEGHRMGVTVVKNA